MIEQGLKPRWVDKRDYDFFKSHPQFGIAKPTEYVEFSVDPGFPIGNQNAMGLPFGCTGMTQAYLCSAEDKIQADPAEIFNNTPPYVPTQGRDIRQSLKRICTAGYRPYLTQEQPANPRKGYFSIRAQGPLDWFDATYLALLSTKDENRAASIGIPWFPEFNEPDSFGRIPMPRDFKLSRITGWHNVAGSGLVKVQDEPRLRIVPWLGEDYAINGEGSMGRELFNALLNINMTEAFTVSKFVPGQVNTINLDIVEAIVGFIRHLLGYD